MTRQKLKIGYVIDPISSFDVEAETTFFFLKEGTRRGFENWIVELKDIFLKNGKILAAAKKVEVFQRQKKFSYTFIDSKTIDLGLLHVLFLRKDPPVDLNYLNHLTLLEMLENSGSPSPQPSPPRLGEASGVAWVEGEGGRRPGEGALGRPLFINSPRGIKWANEKIFPLHFPGLSPPTMVSQSESILLSFIKEHQKVVLKPLNSSGGRGIFILQHSDANKGSLLEGATIGFTDYVMLQKYIPEAKKGDKRILLFNGKLLGCFLRVPSKIDFRGNMHQGAKWVKSKLTPHEKNVVRDLGYQLVSAGLLFVGLDSIGPYITEINSTSPMGIREINQIDNSHCEKIIFDSFSSLLF